MSSVYFADDFDACLVLVISAPRGGRVHVSRLLILSDADCCRRSSSPISLGALLMSTGSGCAEVNILLGTLMTFIARGCRRFHHMTTKVSVFLLCVKKMPPAYWCAVLRGTLQITMIVYVHILNHFPVKHKCQSCNSISQINI